MYTYHTTKNRIPIYIAGKKRPVGHVEGDVFHKNIRFSEHALRRPPAIAFDVQSLEDAEQAGARRVHVRDTETNTVYKSTMSQIWRAGFDLDRGFGKQRALILSAWVRQGQALQLDMFQGVGA